MPVVSTKSIATYSQPLTRRNVIFLLRRTMFGAKLADVNALTGKTLSQIIDILCTAPATMQPPLNNYNNTTADPNVAFGQTWVAAPVDVNLLGERMKSFKAWLIGNMLAQNTSLVEKMALFLQNSLPIESDTVDDARLLYNNYTYLRTHCFGNYKQIVKDISKDAAMLRYLNGEKNNVQSPDENYGRELQELFTVGKGSANLYTEDDVKQAAKCLTGYQIDPTTLKYIFTPSRHDTSDKTFSAFYKNTKITGKSGANGEQELNDLVDMIFAQDEVAKFFCRKLYKWFVYYDIDASVEQNVIAPLAQVMISNNYEILPVLKALLSSEHFWDSENFGAYIKSPLDFIVGYANEMNLNLPNSAQLELQYSFWLDLAYFAAALRQEVYNPPSVSGWEAYYQLPLFHENWINTNTVTKRIQLSVYLMIGYVKNNYTLLFDVLEYTKKFSAPSDVNVVISSALDNLYSIEPTTDMTAKLKAILLYGQVSDKYWTNAWNDYIANPTDTSKKQIVQNLLTLFYKQIFEWAEYQLT